MATNEATYPIDPVPLSGTRRVQPIAALLGYGALAGLLAVSAVVAAAAASARTFLVPAVQHGFPGWIAGPLAGLGDPLTRPGFAVALALLCVAYGVALACRGAMSPRVVIGAIVALHVIFLLAPPLLTADVFSYIDYARLGALHGIDPYAHTPLAAPHDAVFRFVGWRGVSSAYGPLFTLLSYPLALLSVAGALWSLKALAALASLACVALIWRCARLLGRPPLTAAMLFGLNPIVLVYAVGGAHNDLLMLCLTLVGVWLALSARERLGAASVVLGAAIKATSVAVLPFMVAGLRRRVSVLTGAAAATLAVGVAAVLAFSTHALGFFTVVQQNEELTSSDSFPATVANLFSPRYLGDVRLAAHIGLALALLYLLWRTGRGADWVANAGWALLAIVLTAGFLVPWYTLWPLPFAALSRDRRLLVGTLLTELLFLAHRLPPLIAA